MIWKLCFVCQSRLQRIGKNTDEVLTIKKSAAADEFARRHRAVTKDDQCDKLAVDVQVLLT